MSRRSWSSAINQMARAGARAHRAHVRELAYQEREMARLQREQAKYDKAVYIGLRTQEAEAENAHVAQTLAALQSLLTTALNAPHDVAAKALYFRANEADLDAQPQLVVPAEPQRSDFMPKSLGLFGGMMPGAKQKHRAATEAGESAHGEAMRYRQEILNARAAAFERLQEDVRTHNRQIDELFAALARGEPEALVGYAEVLLGASRYPEGFPQEARIGLVPESNQLVVEYELPLINAIIPDVDQYRYVKASDQITNKKRADKARSAEYLNAIAQVTLRTVYEIFASKQLARITSVVFNGYVNTIDPGTGRPIAPHLISVRAMREEFSSLDLRNVEPTACLKRLSATVSPKPSELQPVRPIIDFNMVDPRFVQEQDVLGALDQRQNLMELTPGQFESLITNLFQKMGLETRLTQASRDGGVDCVAFDNRPVLGGKVVIQAKRYKNTVGVSAVRDLFGTLHNEGASKGILVTTSGFGAASSEFANGKPIELISGGELLYMLKEHAGIEAKIEMPADWVDPAS